MDPMRKDMFIIQASIFPGDMLVLGKVPVDDLRKRIQPIQPVDCLYSLSPAKTLVHSGMFSKSAPFMKMNRLSTHFEPKFGQTPRYSIYLLTFLFKKYHNQ